MSDDLKKRDVEIMIERKIADELQRNLDLRLTYDGATLTVQLLYRSALLKSKRVDLPQ